MTYTCNLIHFYDTKHISPNISYSGTTYTHQVCQIVDSYTDLYQKIYQLWKLGHFVTSLTATGKKWAFVMSRDAEFSAQVVLLFTNANSRFTVN